jgi:hypothetical protein
MKIIVMMKNLMISKIIIQNKSDSMFVLIPLVIKLHHKILKQSKLNV